jgi:hypothetical protein
MLAMPESSSIMPSTAPRRNLVISSFIDLALRGSSPGELWRHASLINCH